MPLQVALVAADRQVWTGEADMVIAKTIEGDIGVLPGHEPLLGVLASGPVQIRSVGGQAVVAAVDGGFLSVAEDSVSILVEQAELSGEIDRAAAEEELRRAEAEGDEAAARRARARVAAATR